MLYFTASYSQLNAYKKRKGLLFKRMKVGTIGMCIIILFLSWLQEWLPMQNRQFWNKGTSYSTKQAFHLIYNIIFLISLA